MLDLKLWIRQRGIGQALAMAMGAAAYVLLPWSGFAQAGAVVYIVLAAAWPALALRLVVLSTPFYLVGSDLFPKAVDTLPFSLTEFLLVGVLLGVVARDLRLAIGSGWSLRGRLPTDWPVMLFLVGAVLAGLAAVDSGTHLRGLLVLVIGPLLFFWLVRKESATEEDLLGLLDAWLLAGVAVSLFAFYQYLFTNDTIVAEGVARARGAYGSPNNLGIYLARALPVGACLAVWGARRRGLYAAASAAMLMALALTFSLGAWVGAAAALLFASLAGSRRRLALGIVVALALAFLAGWSFGLPRIVSHFSLDAATWRWRTAVWQAGWNMAWDHPLLGIGLDNFLGLYRQYMLPDAWPEPNLSHPHNIVLDFWLSTGLLGLIGGGWLVARQALRSWGLWRQGASPQLRAVGLGLTASAVDLLVHGVFDNSYFLVDLAIVFWLAQALALARPQAQIAAAAEPAGKRWAEKGEGRAPGAVSPQGP